MTDAPETPEKRFVAQFAMVDLPDAVEIQKLPENEVVEYRRADLPPRVKPLEFEERRNNNFRAREYEIRHSQNDQWRIAFNGKLVCRRINGFDRAVSWANYHHKTRTLSALEV